jgi:XapX domain-containing protein
MKEVIMATLTGLAVGVLFSFLKLPLPAPPTLAGVMGIVGMFVGFVIMNHIF